VTLRGERGGDESERKNEGGDLRCMGDAAVHHWYFPSVGGGELKLRLEAIGFAVTRDLSVSRRGRPPASW
jgi:hypothetical protein